jgi:alpha-glucosidase (family GH31 glycosyl hydrolase)
MRNAILTKYNLVAYYYTQMVMISEGKRAALFKPLFFEFPNDANTYLD